MLVYEIMTHNFDDPSDLIPVGLNNLIDISKKRCNDLRCI